MRGGEESLQHGFSELLGEGEKLVGAVGHLLALDMILWKNRLNRMFDKV